MSMRAWHWTVYHRESDKAIIASGVTDADDGAQRLVETAMRVGDAVAGYGVVTGPGCTQVVCRRGTDPGTLVWRPMHEDPKLSAAPAYGERVLGTEEPGPTQSADVP